MPVEAEAVFRGFARQSPGSLAEAAQSRPLASQPGHLIRGLSALPGSTRELAENVNAWSIPKRAINPSSYHDMSEADIERMAAMLIDLASTRICHNRTTLQPLGGPVSAPADNGRATAPCRPSI
jgi:hypothetical protein